MIRFGVLLRQNSGNGFGARMSLEVNEDEEKIRYEEQRKTIAQKKKNRGRQRRFCLILGVEREKKLGQSWSGDCQWASALALLQQPTRKPTSRYLHKDEFVNFVRENRKIGCKSYEFTNFKRYMFLFKRYLKQVHISSNQSLRKF